MTPSTRSRGYLPHLEAQQAIYFVTFRLVDSLPKEIVLQLRNARKEIERARLAAAQELPISLACPSCGLCCERPSDASTAG